MVHGFSVFWRQAYNTISRIYIILIIYIISYKKRKCDHWMVSSLTLFMFKLIIAHVLIMPLCIIVFSLIKNLKKNIYDYKREKA